jgi:hypothetical protein
MRDPLVWSRTNMDIVAISESLRPVTDWIAQNWPILAIAISCYLLFPLVPVDSAVRDGRLIDKAGFSSNWQLALLLPRPAIVLSLAYPGDDLGSANFTNGRC